MNTKNEVNQLWQEFRQSINTTYANAPKSAEYADATCLRDYAEDISWSDDLAALLGRESAEERKHRSNRPAPKDFSIGTAAKLLIMENVVSGAARAEMPKATAFLECRHTAIESQVIGWLIRENLHSDWIARVKALDYAKLMQA